MVNNYIVSFRVKLTKFELGPTLRKGFETNDPD
jgi:hypothetical protein